jgi:hypothetical protein
MQTVDVSEALEHFTLQHLLQFVTIYNYVRFEVFTAVTMKNDVFWEVTSCGSCKNRRFGGTLRLLHQGDKNRLTRNAGCN